jgi:hypothetical protein
MYMQRALHNHSLQREREKFIDKERVCSLSFSSSSSTSTCQMSIPMGRQKRGRKGTYWNTLISANPREDTSERSSQQPCLGFACISSLRACLPRRLLRLRMPLVRLARTKT